MSQASSAAPRLRSAAQGLRIFLPFAGGYFLSYLLRTVNGPASSGLVREFGLGPRDLGLLTSVYFLTFAAFQIPAGVLIDRYGPRRVQATLFLATAIGTFLFASATNSGTLVLGRALIGFGCSGAFVTGVKALALWLPADRRVAGNACLVACGGLGAVTSSLPLGFDLDWRMLFYVIGALALTVAALVWLLVPETASSPSVGPGKVWLELLHVINNRRFWRVAPLSASIVGSAFAIHGLWAARWLRDVGGMSVDQIGLVLVAMGFALIAGAACFGLLGVQFCKRRIRTSQLFGWASVAFMLVEVVIASGLPVPPLLTFVALAPFGAITVLSFTMIGEMYSPDMTGRANGALNVLHLGTAFVMQAGIGAIVALWPAHLEGHAPATAYATALMLIVALQAVSLAWFSLQR